MGDASGKDLMNMVIQIRSDVQKIFSGILLQHNVQVASFEKDLSISC